LRRRTASQAPSTLLRRCPVDLQSDDRAGRRASLRPAASAPGGWQCDEEASAAAALADKLHAAVDANTNAVAVIRKHVAGNLASRRTDFLTTAGEKPDGSPHDFPRDVCADRASRAGS
jgi:hypothetical protein